MWIAPGFHLTYCSNIHPGESWDEVRANLEKYLPAIQQQLGSPLPMGVGLRLSAQAAEALEKPAELARFGEFLKRHHYYVFTINGFPYGAFHRTRVKEAVYLPDWRDRRRVNYSNRLARILAELLPKDQNLEGSVSTVPCAYKEAVQGAEDVERMADLLLQHVGYLHRLREKTGKTVMLALEPEPCCLIETVDEAIEFFNAQLFSHRAVQKTARSLGLGETQGEEVVRRHLGICYDACHMAVEFEEPASALEKLRAAGIRIGKIQISSALRARLSGDREAASLLDPFTEPVYLHQVVERSSAGLKRYRDLPEALIHHAKRRKEDQRCAEKEWRVHFHVPIFLARARDLETTQDHLVALLDLLKKDPVSSHLEVETYTWDVLPEQYRSMELSSAIVRELQWVRDRMAP